MTYRPHSNKSRRYNWLLVGGIFIVLVLVFGTRFNMPAPLEQIAQTTARPFWNLRATATANMAGVGSVFSSRVQLAHTNAALQKENEMLKAQVVGFSTLAQEHQTLKELFANTTSPETAILGRILARPPLTPYDIVIVDVGAREGVRNDAHITIGSVVLGKAQDVFDHSLSAQLFSSAGVETSVFLSHQEMTTTAEGVGAGNIRLRIPRDIAIAKGDEILLEGTSLLIGVVQEIQRGPADAFQTVLTRTPLNLSQLVFVTVENT